MREVLRALERGLVVEGLFSRGTGLALRLGHRLSVAFDFFIREPFDEDILLQRVQLLPGIDSVQRDPRHCTWPFRAST
jgi:hypothetical protein